jgi:hypothetical protein
VRGDDKYTGPLTVAQELEALTEKPNSAAEGLEPVGEGAVTAPLITSDFIRLARCGDVVVPVCVLCGRVLCARRVLVGASCRVVY